MSLVSLLVAAALAAATGETVALVGGMGYAPLTAAAFPYSLWRLR